jgi:hypothetical protein
MTSDLLRKLSVIAFGEDRTASPDKTAEVQRMLSRIIGEPAGPVGEYAERPSRYRDECAVWLLRQKELDSLLHLGCKLEG